MSIEELIKEGSIHPFKATREEINRATGHYVVLSDYTYIVVND